MYGAIAASLLLTSVQPAEDWQQVTETSRGQVLADLASRQREGDIVTLRSRTVFAEALPDGTSSVLVRMRYDCRRNRSETLAVTMIDADGTTLSAQDVPADQRRMEPIVPDSPDAAVAAFACR